jgi:hypothetical protein
MIKDEGVKELEVQMMGLLGKPAINLNDYLALYGEPLKRSDVIATFNEILCPYCKAYTKAPPFSGNEFWALALARPKDNPNFFHLCVPILTPPAILWGICQCWASVHPDTHDIFLLFPNLKVLLALQLLPFPLWRPPNPEHYYYVPDPIAATTLMVKDCWGVFISPPPPTFNDIKEGACMVALSEQRGLRGQPLFWDDQPNILNALNLNRNNNLNCFKGTQP